MTRIAVIDFETTGISPAMGDRATEVALVLMEGGQVVDRFASLMNAGVRVPSFITKLTGITQAEVADAPTPQDVLRRFSEFVGRDATLIAHNGLRFDMRFIAESCKRLDMPVRETRALDSRSFSRKIWGGHGGHGLDAVLGRVGVSSEGVKRHDARGDVQLLARAVQYMWERLTPNVNNCPVDCSVGVIPALV